MSAVSGTENGEFVLSFLDSHLVVDAAGVEIGMALDFLSTHFAIDRTNDPNREVLARLELRPETELDELFSSSNNWPELFVRKSASEFFTIPARRAHVDGLELVECTKTNTRMVFDSARKHIRVALGPNGQLDLVELIRDIVLKDQENRGAVVLHATCAQKDGSTVLIAGGKGAGKSTILLELVEHFGHAVVSGDKTLAFALPDDRVSIVGWPDYPHLGYATIEKFAGLGQIAGIEDGFVPSAGHEFSPYGKFAVDPFGFRDRFASAPVGFSGSIDSILHPRIGPGAVTVLQAVDSPKNRALLAENVESAFTGKHAGWQQFSVDGTAGHQQNREWVLDRLAQLPAWQVTGPGDLAAVALPFTSRVDA